MEIKVNNLEFAYSNEKILKDINFTVLKGQCVSILGPNGAGKSTLIKCMDGLLKCKKGEIVIDGKKLSGMSREDIAKKIAYVPQVTASIFPLKVFDMVLLGRRLHMNLKSKKENHLKVLDALKMLSIEHLAMRNFNQLSGGQKQKVVIAKAMAQETEILLLDEAISNLDIRHQLEVMDLVKKLSSEFGITVVMILHDLNIASRFSDKIIILNNGEISANGDAKEVLTKENISSIYGIESYITKIEDKPHIVPLKIRKI
ncbi:MAG: ABC transporter ATP-binding protein [Bacillota bacterium]|nr:ABC transporter ATP-binding protein [Bacillota bacterium]